MAVSKRHWFLRGATRRALPLRYARLHLESLESRCVLTAFCDLGSCLAIPMLPVFDTFGNQIETVQAYGEGDSALVGYGIYDTGASVITWSAGDQLLFQLTTPDEQGIPVKVPGGAGADAIGGVLIGDVSEPGLIRADGLHALEITSGFEVFVNFENPGSAEGVQSFIGTTSGSPQLPTITGVPINFPSARHTYPTGPELTLDGDLGDQLGSAAASGLAGAQLLTASGAIETALDVDLMAVNLLSGDNLRVDVDHDTLGDSVLRIFDSAGNEVAVSDNDAAPLEDESNESYLNFTAPYDDVFYVGISGGGNNNYDPHSSGSGTAGSTGSYNVRVVLNLGVAAWIDMDAFEYDLGEMFPEFGELFEDIVLYAPDIFFVDPAEPLEISPNDDTTEPIRIPLTMWGDDNHANPGDQITYVENPVQENVYLRREVLLEEGSDVFEASNKTLLFDTGAQLSVISSDVAAELGLDLEAPQMTIDVQGAAGSSSIPGYILDELQLPIDNDGDGVFDGGLQFTNVAIFVLDTVPGLDGILGMNLFNTADVMLYDPFDPLGASLKTRFFTDLVREEVTIDETDGLGEWELDLISQAFPTLAGSMPSSVRTLANLGLGSLPAQTTVVGRHLFYNDSALDGHDPQANAADDAAIAGGIAALLPGQSSAAEHVSGFTGGITGVMIDVAGLSDPAALSANDFEFRFGNSSEPAAWDHAPPPQSISVREGAGASGADRVMLTWNAGELTNGWLEVRLKASQATGLAADDVFYFGHRTGDATGDGQVNADDVALIRANPRDFLSPASAGDRFDLNHDRRVNATDLLLVREHATNLSNQLTMLAPPAGNFNGGTLATLTRLTAAPPAAASPATIAGAAAYAEADRAADPEPGEPTLHLPSALAAEQTSADVLALDSFMAAYAAAAPAPAGTMALPGEQNSAHSELLEWDTLGMPWPHANEHEG